MFNVFCWVSRLVVSHDVLGKKKAWSGSREFGILFFFCCSMTDEPWGQGGLQEALGRTTGSAKRDGRAFRKKKHSYFFQVMRNNGDDSRCEG
jgi:hypothetical protein